MDRQHDLDGVQLAIFDEIEEKLHCTLTFVHRRRCESSSAVSPGVGRRECHHSRRLRCRLGCCTHAGVNQCMAPMAIVSLKATIAVKSGSLLINFAAALISTFNRIVTHNNRRAALRPTLSDHGPLVPLLAHGGRRVSFWSADNTDLAVAERQQMLGLGISTVFVIAANCRNIRILAIPDDDNWIAFASKNGGDFTMIGHGEADDHAVGQLPTQQATFDMIVVGEMDCGEQQAVVSNRQRMINDRE